MPRPKRSSASARIHIVLDRELKESMETWWRMHFGGKMPQGTWQRFVEEAIREFLDI